MRVVGGIFGGRTLHAPRGPATRPTSERVREALFSMLGVLDGARVLDLFAGSGALGIEALSRGAQSALFVERAPAALRSLERNLAALELAPPRAVVHRGEAAVALRVAKRRGDKYDLVLLDPPYAQAKELGEFISSGLTCLLAPGARVVCETDRRDAIGLQLALELERRYGDTVIRIHVNQEQGT